MAARIDLTLDGTDVQALAVFWKTALGYVDEPPPAPFETRAQWFAQFDLPKDDSVDDGAWLCDPDGVGPRFCILKVPESKTAKNRLHIDIRVPGHGSSDELSARIKAESERLVRAGGTVLEKFDGHHVVMADPEGNEFCVAAASA
ncbi:VOC family protein [Streptomyces olivaceus]|uniref:VOC family protein n=1 Tax=Streptomyces olivaceus TaxID=47716 RepID=A0ABS7WFR3_STROV|nr:VOC family protein [Streptomyces olivaceus]MBZ6093509.1 VOC family protein [Streptomyces olivaceus]MBZ6100442.1 VOC family protein [Streptomyces olivaceus]MBZ6121606.1 VOC family protein [Streptomyces olivaceus]MBZ6156342.1 VOC family protein [Streptomyces olivaceus]MBZ6302868.1 VOC family protein [Streptomyces olivaceus]